MLFQLFVQCLLGIPKHFLMLCSHYSYSCVQILLNEVAPRPHNSGHHTIESCFTSQYEQQLRAILGLQLGDPSMKTQAAIMYNILGEDEVKYICLVKIPPSSKLTSNN